MIDHLETNWRSWFFSPEFTDLTIEQQSKKIIEVSETVYGMWADGHYVLSDRMQTYLTTIILRANCGCTVEEFEDPTSGEWITIDAHGQNCHRVVYPIEEDLSDSTIMRRKKRESLKGDFTCLEESSYAA